MKNLRVFGCMFVCLQLVLHVPDNLKNVKSALKIFDGCFEGQDIPENSKTTEVFLNFLYVNVFQIKALRK